jgi:hypothetical protein
VKAAAVLVAVLAGAALAAEPPPPWRRTETRAPCDAFAPLRAPFFGETHVHTSYSFDANIGDVRNTPHDAYAFARGTPLGLPPYDAGGAPLRTVRLRRPLDFTAVTDHAEQFGEVRICESPDDPNYGQSECVLLRDALGTAVPLPPPQQPPAVFTWAVPYTGLMPFHRFAWCDGSGAPCLAAASVVWRDTQDAAEEAYDRSAACTFTSFVAYEWSTTPLGVNLHRNVVFRNATVPALPTSAVEASTARGLWDALRAQCLDGLPGCDVLAIPHNANLSLGHMFLPETSAADAAFRAEMEPLVELIQHKGDSECHPGVLTNDEQCGFEKMMRTTLSDTDPSHVYYPNAFVRNVLKDGLAQEEALGVNPFRLGFVGGTDSHNGTPGLVDEADFVGAGALGTRDATPAFMGSPYPLGGIEANPGGLTVAWAEENSRDALFSALRRRETYATSGPRPLVRFFGGRLAGVGCGKGDFVARGYRDGVPMGGELGSVRGARGPRFAVLAMQDPGGGGEPSTPLQRVEIVKGWVDGTGATQEKVFEVTGDANDGAHVDVGTCEPVGYGFDRLCKVWTDADFDPAERAFYYARVIENPVCRWSTRLCNAQGVDCAVPASVPAELATCCDDRFPKTIQERAWTSPIWYRPEAIAGVRGGIRFGARPGADVLTLTIDVGRLPASLDPTNAPLDVAVEDDGPIWAVTIPAGALAGRGATARWDAHGAGGVARATLRVRRGAGTLRIRTVPLDLSSAERVDHFVSVALTSGTYTSSHTRVWQLHGTRLAPAG